MSEPANPPAPLPPADTVVAPLSDADLVYRRHMVASQIRIMKMTGSEYTSETNDLLLLRERYSKEMADRGLVEDWTKR